VSTEEEDGRLSDRDYQETVRTIPQEVRGVVWKDLLAEMERQQGGKA